LASASSRDDHRQGQLDPYFDQVLAAFKSLSKVVSAKTVVVQMVAFSEPRWQLPRYLKVMEQAGFTENKIPGLANKRDGRIWRSVPKEPLNKDRSVIEKRRFPISSRLWVLISLPCGPLPQFGGGVRRHYAAADSSFLRTRNRFTRAKAANNRLAFFAKPR
jgi:hypothetical protein